ncbi:MAG: hypothetical protein EOP87_17790, partial [Verrucomicrobiaceae bacterium]
MAVMESMASATGMEDRKAKDRLSSMIRMILWEWVDTDLEGILKIVRDTSDTAVKDRMLRDILERLENKKEVEQVLALEIEFLKENGYFRTHVPQFALEAKLREGATAYLELMERLPFTRGGGGTPGRFPADFDFQLAADGMANL